MSVRKITSSGIYSGDSDRQGLGKLTFRFMELFEYKPLVLGLISMDLRTRYKGSWLGFLWTFMNPLLMLIVYSLVFKTIMRTTIPHYTMYMFVGLIPWTAFQTSVISSSSCLISNANLVKKIYFPREALPLATVLASQVNFVLTLVIMVPALLIFGIHLTWAALFFPVVLCVQTALSFGLALLFSSLTVFFRDLEHVLTIFIMAWFYLTPVIYNPDMMPKRYQRLLDLNPMTPIVNAYHDVLFYGKLPSLHQFAYVFIFTIIILFVGLSLFERLNTRFVEEI